MDRTTDLFLKTNAAVEAEQRARAARLLVSEAAKELGESERLRRSGRHSFSIVKFVRAMTAEGGGGLRDGIEAELAQETARQANVLFDPNRPMLPWSALLGARTLQAGTSAQGGYLVGTGAPMVAEALRPWSITLQAGITVLPDLVGDVTIPRETASAGQWLTSETGTGTASDLSFTAAAMKPKNALAFVQITGRLLQQSPLAEGLIQRSLRRTLGSLVDQAVIAGSGTNGQPTGIINVSGVQVTTGTSLTYANLLNEQEQVALGNVQDASHAWVGHPTVRELLAARAIGTSAGIAPFMWQDDRILNRAAFVTTDVGTGRIVHGDWSQVALGLWGPGFTLEHDPYSGFQSNIHGFRVVVAADVGVMATAAMRVVSGIT